MRVDKRGDQFVLYGAIRHENEYTPYERYEKGKIGLAPSPLDLSCFAKFAYISMCILGLRPRVKARPACCSSRLPYYNNNIEWTTEHRILLHMGT